MTVGDLFPLGVDEVCNLPSNQATEWYAQTALYNKYYNAVLEETFFLIGFEEATMLCTDIWRGHRARNSKIKIGALKPAAACKYQTSANNHVILEDNLVKLKGENQLHRAVPWPLHIHMCLPSTCTHTHVTHILTVFNNKNPEPAGGGTHL